jgi:outer membrane protein TolC
MTKPTSARRPPPSGWGACLGALLCAGLVSALARAEPVPAPTVLPPPRPVSEPAPVPLSAATAVRWALERNPALAAVRQQHGIAAAGVVIARTYPFNPTSENRVQPDGGPFAAGITNRVALEDLLLLEVELRGQGAIRQQGAAATLTRTDWDIAAQEQTVAVQALRAFNTLLYRREKLRLIDETIRLDERFLQEAQELFNAGRLKATDLIVARAELAAVRGTLGMGRTNLTTARADLSRALGIVDGAFELQGTLEMTVPALEPAALTRLALARRADLRAKRAAEAEAEAALRLTVANRFGNPTLGPAFSYNETRVYFIGAQVNVPLPVLNTHRGDILQHEAQLSQAVFQTRQTEVLVRQDVTAALARLETARRWAETYRDQILPGLQEDLERVERLFVKGDATADVLHVLDIRRKLLTARDGYLDALFEVTQGLTDIAAAAGEPGLVLPPGPPPLPGAPCAPILTGATAPTPGGDAVPTDMLCLPAIQVAPRRAAPKP